jgi:ribonuclease HII
VGGDGLSLSIAAASILAKVLRDRAMTRLEAHWPGYGFARHMGYPTAAHRAALAQLGPSPHHRRGFAPVDAAWRQAQAARGP